MKIYEVAAKEMEVERTNSSETVLVDPKTGIKTVVPKDPEKPGKIEQDDMGDWKLSTEQNGEVPDELAPGDTVAVSDAD
jgi:hypothetical protein